MNSKTIISHSPANTKKIGKELAKEIWKQGPKNGAFVIGLKGDLGSGKTTFIQGFARGLHIRNRILSPTFVILKRFKISAISNKQLTLKTASPARQALNNQKPFKNFYHLDCYRIDESQEVLNLGFADICQNPENVIVIEWADRIKKILPKHSLILKFKFLDKEKREIRICGYTVVDKYSLTRFFDRIK